MKFVFLYIAIFTSFSICAQSDDEDKGTSKKKKEGFYEWFGARKISIRKTFDGTSKDEGKPASFFWNKDFANSGESFFTIDLGIKMDEWQILATPQLLLSPKFEWHKDGRKDATKKKNDISAGLAIEFQPFRAKKIVPWFTGGIDIQRDFIKKLTTLKPKLFLSLFGPKQGRPGANTLNHAKVFVFRYYPYTGVEYYKATDLEKVNATYWATRIASEYWPITTPEQLADDGTTMLKEEKRYLQLTVDVGYRVSIEDKLFGRGNLYWLAFALNIYPDGRDKFGFGIDYTKGDDPASNFVETDKIMVGIRVKL